jgi:hypothetical protein
MAPAQQRQEQETERLRAQLEHLSREKAALLRLCRLMCGAGSASPEMFLSKSL